MLLSQSGSLENDGLEWQLRFEIGVKVTTNKCTHYWQLDTKLIGQHKREKLSTLVPGKINKGKIYFISQALKTHDSGTKVS